MTQRVITYLIEKGYTSQESAERLGVSKKTVLRAAKHFGLQYRNIPKRADTVDPIVVKKLVNKNYSDVDISKLLKINRSAVGRIITTNGFKRNYSVKLSNRVKAIMVGTLLGDSSLRKHDQTALTCGHSKKQSEYRDWKAKELSVLSPTCYESTRTIPDKRNGNIYHTSGFYTKATVSLNEWFDSFYTPKKVIPENLLQHYNDLSLAVHFMDDGCKTGSSYGLCTQSFSIEHLEIFNKMCKRKFGISWSINKDHGLYLPVKFKDTFTNLVKKHIHPTLMYKLH